MTDETTPVVGWQAWFGAAGTLLAAWFFAQLFRYAVVDAVGNTLWRVHPLVPAVPQVGTARLTAFVSVVIWLALVPVVVVFVVGLTRIWFPTGEGDPTE